MCLTTLAANRYYERCVELHTDVYLAIVQCESQVGYMFSCGINTLWPGLRGAADLISEGSIIPLRQPPT